MYLKMLKIEREVKNMLQFGRLLFWIASGRPSRPMVTSPLQTSTYVTIATIRAAVRSQDELKTAIVVFILTGGEYNLFQFYGVDQNQM